MEIHSRILFLEEKSESATSSWQSGGSSGCQDQGVGHIREKGEKRALLFCLPQSLLMTSTAAALRLAPGRCTTASPAALHAPPAECPDRGPVAGEETDSSKREDGDRAGEVIKMEDQQEGGTPSFPSHSADCGLKSRPVVGTVKSGRGLATSITGHCTGTHQ